MRRAEGREQSERKFVGRRCNALAPTRLLLDADVPLFVAYKNLPSSLNINSAALLNPSSGIFLLGKVLAYPKPALSAPVTMSTSKVST